MVTRHSSGSIFSLSKLAYFFPFLLLSLKTSNSLASVFCVYIAISSNQLLTQNTNQGLFLSDFLSTCSLDLNFNVLLMGISFSFICQEAPLTAREMCCFPISKYQCKICSV